MVLRGVTPVTPIITMVITYSLRILRRTMTTARFGVLTMVPIMKKYEG